ncbi:MAG: LAGLIDADG family homing endonuclease [Sulfolobus sp.]|nr:LAGLIDADG family homing endonuclease [Sulfolobus sp.]
MSAIARLLGVSVTSIQANTNYPQYRVRTGSLVSNAAIRTYLTHYSLMSSKRCDFNDWCTVQDYLARGTQMSNKEHILMIKARMNSKRTEFNWDHLS